jgi:hypothetical protein
MSTKFLLQTMALLFLGQLLLGWLGWLLVGAAPWAGLPVTLLLVWFLYRLARVFRDEVQQAIRRDEPVQPGRLAVFVALAAQLPSLALLPYWAPEWIVKLWQGAVLPVPATLSMIWAGAGAAVPWLWVSSALEIALFAWVVTAPEKKVQTYAAPPVKAAAGDWAPARRVSDVQKKGRRVK